MERERLEAERRERERLVLKRSDDPYPAGQCLLKGRQLGPEHKTLEDSSGFPVESEYTATQPVGIAGGGLRRLVIQRRDRHVHGARQVCNPRSNRAISVVERQHQ